MILRRAQDEWVWRWRMLGMADVGDGGSFGSGGDVGGWWWSGRGVVVYGAGVLGVCLRNNVLNDNRLYQSYCNDIIHIKAYY